MAQFDRVYQYKAIFQRRKSISKQDLLSTLEISEATFKRDLDKMRDVYNYDIVYDRFANAYKLQNESASYELPGLMFSQQELLALLTIQNMIDQLEPGLRKQMLKEMKAITKDPIREIKSVIPSTAPMSGMSVTRTGTSMTDRNFNNNPPGRLSWTGGKYKNRVIAPDDVIPRFSCSRSRRSAVTSLFGIWLRAPGVAMLATAGKRSGRPKYATTREYPYKGGVRRHKNNGQGEAFIRKVKNTGLYNFFYRAGEKTVPSMEGEVKLVWEKYSSKVSRKLK